MEELSGRLPDIQLTPNSEFPCLEIKEPPTYWTELRSDLTVFMRVFEHKIDGLRVIRSRSTTKDGADWIHLSTSRKSRLPNYDDLAKVKRDFLGEEVEAYQVMARKSEHVNCNPYCLHIWAPIDQKRRVANLHDLVLEVGV